MTDDQQHLIAAAALQGLLANPANANRTPEEIVTGAWRYAALMYELSPNTAADRHFHAKNQAALDKILAERSSR